MEIILTQKNRLRLSPEEHKLVTAMSYHSARLYNVGLYSVRQFFFLNNEYLNYAKNYHECKNNENYKLLLSDTAQQILRLVERNFKSFFALLTLKKAGKYSERVSIPKYKGKEELGIVAIQGRSARIHGNKVRVGFSKAFKELYQPSMKYLEFTLPKHIQVSKLQELRINPLFGGREFDIEFVYKKEVEPVQSLDANKFLSIDMGLNNFATCFSSVDGSSFIIDGRYIKAINHRYNKTLARLQSIKDQQGIKKPTRRIFNLSRKRGFQMNDSFNRAVKYITDECLRQGIGSIVVGNFSDIKREINMGKRNNQNFVQIPFGLFRQKLKSKCQQLGIEYHAAEESYTSKTSFLDNEPVQKHEQYLGKRIKRGLFRAANGRVVNADVNGAANILRKFLASTSRLTDLYCERVVKGFVNNPERVKFGNLLSSSSKAPAIASA